MNVLDIGDLFNFVVALAPMFTEACDFTQIKTGNEIFADFLKLTPKWCHILLFDTNGA